MLEDVPEAAALVWSADDDQSHLIDVARGFSPRLTVAGLASPERLPEILPAALAGRGRGRRDRRRAGRSVLPATPAGRHPAPAADRPPAVLPPRRDSRP